VFGAFEPAAAFTTLFVAFMGSVVFLDVVLLEVADFVSTSSCVLGVGSESATDETFFKVVTLRLAERSITWAKLFSPTRFPKGCSSTPERKLTTSKGNTLGGRHRMCFSDLFIAVGRSWNLRNKNVDEGYVGAPLFANVHVTDFLTSDRTMETLPLAPAAATGKLSEEREVKRGWKGNTFVRKQG
jgi:hypothetical protein